MIFYPEIFIPSEILEIDPELDEKCAFSFSACHAFFLFKFNRFFPPFSCKIFLFAFQK